MIPTESPQLPSGKAGHPGTPPGRPAKPKSPQVRSARSGSSRALAAGTEEGRRRECEAETEEKLAARIEKITERLEADAPKMTLPGADLIAWYLSADRLPVKAQWSRRHAHTQRRLCERFAAPVIAAVTCQDIKASHMQQIVNAAPTPGEGDRVQGMISALVAAGIDGLRWESWSPSPSSRSTSRPG
jgi:hypothetical protein